MPRNGNGKFSDDAPSEAMTLSDQPADEASFAELREPMPDAPFFPPGVAPTAAPEVAETAQEEPDERLVWVRALATRPLRYNPAGHLDSAAKGAKWLQPEALARKQEGAGLVRIVEEPAA